MNPHLEILPTTAEKRKVRADVIVGYPLTDIGNAQRLMHYHGDDLRYCYQAKRWFIWNGQRWEEDRNGEIDRRAEAVTNMILQEAAREDDAKAKKAKWTMNNHYGRHSF